MVCPKLIKGTCKILRVKCERPYLTKMILWGRCPTLKKLKLTKQPVIIKKKVKRKVVTKKKVSKRRK
ncbi:hypothetical protein J4436_01625 [Candidatus Woesearchaeota archaeon]|nr:hypothetical protein [Candidatus Woesearchaeota archaeon]